MAGKLPPKLLHRRCIKWGFTRSGSVMHGNQQFNGKKQSEIETAKEIIDLVEKCLNSGVNDVYVAGLTPRPQFSRKK